MPWRLKPRLQPSKGPAAFFALPTHTAASWSGRRQDDQSAAASITAQSNIGAGVMVPAAPQGSANEAPRFGLFDAQSKRTLCCATGICARTFFTRASSIRAETIPTPSEALAMTWPQGSAISEWP